MTEQQRDDFKRWADAALYIADANGISDDTEIPTWPRGRPGDELMERYPQLNIGAVREAMAALSHAEGEAVEPIGYLTLQAVARLQGDDRLNGEHLYAFDPDDMSKFRGVYLHPAPQVAGLTETAIKSSPAYRALHREKEHLLGLLKDQAPQVAVPEDAAQDRRIVSAMAADLGRIAEALDIDPDEGGAAPILAAINEMKSRCAVPSGWKPVPVEPTNEMISAGADASNAYRVDIMRSYDAMLAAAPTAPAGETEPDVADIELGHVIEWAEAVGCVEVEPRHDDAEFLVARAILDARRQQPVSDPDGLPEPPFDAAHDARVFADRVEMKYGVRCQAGDIADCYEWQQLRQCLAAMAEYVDLATDERDIAALLERIVPRIDPQNPKPLDKSEHCCECTLYYERERIHDEIARLRKLGGNHD